MKANIIWVLKFLILLFLLFAIFCAYVPKKQCEGLKGEFMIVDEDKDLDFLRIEEVSAEEVPSGGCPT